MLRGNHRTFVATFVLITIFAGWHTWQMHGHAQRISLPLSADNPVHLPHRLIRPEFAADGHLWIQFAERIATGETLRVRETKIDNAPTGREVHWSSGYAWWLAAIGFLWHKVSGMPPSHAMEHAALWANLPLFLVILFALSGWATRLHGTLAGILTALALFGNRALYGGFWPGNADHHGIAGAANLACIIGAAAMQGGWRAGEPDPNARRAAMWSGVWGGVALWISASTALPLLGGIGLAALLATWMQRRELRALRFDAAVWRRWGRVGAGVSLCFYLLEYFPSHLGWRLEVNHPLYALAWWAGAELLAVLLPAVASGDFRWAGPRYRLTLAWALPLLLLPLAVVAIARDRVFLPLDPLVAGLHGMILEFLPLWDRWHFEGLAGNFETLLVVPAFYALALWLWFQNRANRWQIAFAVVLLAVPHALGILQSRWTMGALGGEVLLAFAMVRAGQSGVRWSRALAAAVALTIVSPTVPPRIVEAFALGAPDARMPGDDRQLLVQQTAAALRADARGRNVVVWSTPTTALDLSFYGGFQTLGTLYWENRDGLRAMAQIAAARDDDSAAALIRRHGVTHLVFSTDEDVLTEVVQLARSRISARETHDAFAPRVFRRAEIPAWLRALPEVAASTSVAGSPRLQVFAVDFDQTPAEAPFHLAAVLARRGEMDAALAAYARSAELGFAPAHLRRAEILLAAQRWTEAIAALDRAVAAAPPATRYSLLTQAGVALEAAHQRVAAAHFLERALHEQVSDTRAANLLAWLLATASEPSLQRREFALQLARQSARLDPSSPEAWSALAAAWAAQGDFAAALAALERADALPTVAHSSLQQRLVAQRAAYSARRLLIE